MSAPEELKTPGAKRRMKGVWLLLTLKVYLAGLLFMLALRAELKPIAACDDW